MKNKEIFVSIQGYEGIYEVSNMGRVRSLKFGKKKILKPSKDGNGYLFVKLSKNGKIKYFKVHRLVANAFVENPNNLPQINHINEVKTDNRAVNLEWCTNQYNKRFSSAKNVMGIGDNGKKTILLGAVIDGVLFGYKESNISTSANGKYNKQGSHKYKGIEWYFIPKGLYNLLTSLPRINNDIQMIEYR